MLGLISASIELYLELTYEFDTGKMVGRAQLTIKVEVFCFSGLGDDRGRAPVRRLGRAIRASPRRDGAPDGTSPAWSEYCLAFAGA